MLVIPGLPVALAQKACREGFTAICQRLPKLIQELPLAKGDGSYSKLLNRLGKTDVLLLDGWGLSALTPEQWRDLLKYWKIATAHAQPLLTANYRLINGTLTKATQTLANEIMNRLVHNAYKIKLDGDSLRKQQGDFTKTNEIG